MSAAKLFLLSLLIAVFTPSAQTQALPVSAVLTSRDPPPGLVVVSLRGAPLPAAARPLFTDQDSKTSGSTGHSPDKWLLALLSVALVTYQLRRNQRSLNHQLTNQPLKQGSAS